MDPITLQDVQDMVPAPIPAERAAQVEGWVKAMSGWLMVRYGQAPDAGPEVAAARRAVVLAKVADAVGRRLEKSPLMVQQNAGPFGGRWAERAATAAWFLPEELAELDAMHGSGTGSRTYRTPAPRASWATNRASEWDEVGL